MGDNERFYNKFITLFDKDKMNDTIYKKEKLLNLINYIEKREKCKLHIKYSSYTGGLFIYYSTNKIKITNIAKIILFELDLDTEFYDIYVNKIKNFYELLT